MCWAVLQRNGFELGAEGLDVDSGPCFFRPLMSFLEVSFHVSRVEVISYVDVKVAVESGSEDLN